MEHHEITSLKDYVSHLNPNHFVRREYEQMVRDLASERAKNKSKTNVAAVIAIYFGTIAVTIATFVSIAACE